MHAHTYKHIYTPLCIYTGHPIHSSYHYTYECSEEIREENIVYDGTFMWIILNMDAVGEYDII